MSEKIKENHDDGSRNGDLLDRLGKVYPYLAGGISNQFKGATLTNFTKKQSEVRIRKGTQLISQPGDRLRFKVELMLNSGAAAGAFEDEAARADLVQVNDVIQVNHNGPEDLVGGFFQVSDVHAWGVRAFSIIARRYVRLENQQFDRVGPAPLVTERSQGHDTEPMDHHLENGEVIHPTQLKERNAIEQTSPMPHAIKPGEK